MPLTDEQRRFYENNLEVIRTEVLDIKQEVEDELAKVRDRIMELQNEKKSALQLYAALHAAVAHIHPFWDGNGRIARLIANIPLLRSGLPPVVIPKERRREYIQLLAEYELACCTLTRESGAWPMPDRLAEFVRFVADCYRTTRELLEV